MKVEILDRAEADLVSGFEFYEKQQPGLGAYFRETLFHDIDLDFFPATMCAGESNAVPSARLLFKT